MHRKRGKRASESTLGADLHQAWPKQVAGNERGTKQTAPSAEVDAAGQDIKPAGSRAPRAAHRAAEVAGTSGRAVAQFKRVHTADPALAGNLAHMERRTLPHGKGFVRDARRERKPVAMWEYQVVEIREKMIGDRLDGAKLAGLLNQWGAQGWQLKAITSAEVKGRIGPGGVSGLLVTFERRRG